MDRKKFMKNVLFTGIAATVTPFVLNARIKGTKNSTYDQLKEQVGFNHLPNQEEITMNTVLHKASTRGHADHGWLKANHSFSFANYYNPDRMNFGVLRVLNDDIIAAGKGFGTHPHDNMEIITIPLEGALEHKDSMGNGSIIKKYDIQVMSAGTGIMHSEFNPNQVENANIIQIWLFPRERKVKPRYDQLSFKPEDRQNKLQQVLSPNADDEGVWIHQDAWFYLGNFEKGRQVAYKIKKEGNGVYVFVIDGSIMVNGQELGSRDGYGIWDTNEEIKIEAGAEAEYLLMDLPMKV